MSGPSRRVVEASSRAVVAIRVGSLWGSGVVVSPTGYVLTNAHIVRPSADTGGRSLKSGSNLRCCLEGIWREAFAPC